MKKAGAYIILLFLLVIATSCNNNSSSSVSSNNTGITDSSVLIENTVAKMKSEAPIKLIHFMETKHFDIYSPEKGTLNLEEFIKDFEPGYAKISKDLNFDPDNIPGKIKVNIYPDLDSFHSAIGHPEYPSWVIGYGSNGELSFVAPHLFQMSPKSLFYHELTHYICDRIKGSPMPEWLYQGIATYEMYTPEEAKVSIKPKVTSVVLSDKIPTFEDLSTSDEFGNGTGYELSYTIIQFLVEKYDMNKVLELIRNPNDIEGAFKVPEKELESLWKQYLREHY